MARRRTKPLKGHKLTIEWSGEYGVESTSTGTCRCGWTESGSSREIVRDEYGWHIAVERGRLQAAKKQTRKEQS